MTTGTQDQAVFSMAREGPWGTAVPRTIGVDVFDSPPDANVVIDNLENAIGNNGEPGEDDQGVGNRSQRSAA